MTQRRTNQEDPKSADFPNLLRASGLTQQEAARAASLHINTVKKIIRGTAVHPNSRLKLFRALRQAVDAKVIAYPATAKREIPEIADFSPEAKKYAVQQFAEKLSRESFDLAIELVAGRTKLSEDEFSQILGLIDLARTTLTSAHAKK